MPAQLERHAQSLQAQAETAAAEQAALEQAALEAAGVPALAEQVQALEAAIDELSAGIDSEEQRHAQWLAERSRLAEGSDRHTGAALAALARAIAAQPAPSLRQAAAATPEPEDDALALRIGRLRQAQQQLQAQLERGRGEHQARLAALQRLEELRRRFRERQYDAGDSEIGDGVEWGDLIGGVLRGALELGRAWERIERNQRFRLPRGRGPSGPPPGSSVPGGRAAVSAAAVSRAVAALAAAASRPVAASERVAPGGPLHTFSRGADLGTAPCCDRTSGPGEPAGPVSAVTAPRPRQAALGTRAVFWRSLPRRLTTAPSPARFRTLPRVPSQFFFHCRLRPFSASGHPVAWWRPGARLRQGLLVLLVLALAACGGSGDGGTAQVAPPAVTAAEVEEVVWVDTIQALGTARANESVTLTAKVTEVVRRVRFEDGDRVEAGDVLVELTGQAEVAQLEEARAALNEAQKQLDRMEGLVAQGTIPRAQYDTQRASRDSARARANAIRARLANG